MMSGEVLNAVKENLLVSLNMSCSVVFFHRFFKELEARHQNNIFIDDISDIVEKHSSSTFDPYVKYCTNEVYQQRTLQKLL